MHITEQGEIVRQRTYARVKADGERESWRETVERVVDGNLALGDSRHELPGERDELVSMIEDLKIIPAGRHLWASGVRGRQYLFNCWVAPWSAEVTEHFSFTFLRLMEGGGVGSNYSNHLLAEYPEIVGNHDVHIVCDESHPDFEKLRDAGVLSTTYVSDWDGCYEVADSREGWSDALVDLVSTYYRTARNRNRVFDVSRVRGEGERLKSFGGRASGPLPLAHMLHEIAEVLNKRTSRKLDGISAMEIDHAIGKCVVSGGTRRSARMSIMRWDDEQIEQFLQCKRDTGKHWTTNISVEVDDTFFSRLLRGTDDPQRSYADQVLDKIADGMLTNGEPGFWNSSLSNVGEPNPVISTNPCGEIALEAGENCNLGHVNLAGFVDPETGAVDYEGLSRAHVLVTRFLIRATFGDVNDPRSRELLDRNRRIGVGHLGVASFLAMTGVRYSDAPDSVTFMLYLNRWRGDVRESAQEYAHALRIPVPVKTRTVAPTGTIAKLAGVSEGIHPIFAKFFLRRIRFSDVDPDQMTTVDDYRRRGFGVEPDAWAPQTTVVSLPTKDSLLAAVEKIHGVDAAREIVQSAADLTLDDMLRFQRMYQSYWADNAVSYTINVDPSKYTIEQLTDAIRKYGVDLKGCTVFPERGYAQAPYERISEADYSLYEMWLVGDGVDENCANGACPIK